MISIASKHMYLLTLLQGINFGIDDFTEARPIKKKLD